MIDPELLISLYLNDYDSLKQGQLDMLASWIKASPENARHFTHAVFLHRALYDSYSNKLVPVLADSQDEDSIIDDSLWAALAEYEKLSEPIEIAESVPVEETKNKQPIPAKKITNNKIYYWALSSIAALLLFVVSFSFLTSKDIPESLARVIHQDNAQWYQEGVNNVNASLMKGPLILQRGILTIAMFDGTVVELQAPADIRIEQNNRIFLQSGSVQATVPAVATGFTIATPHGLIVDFGTEFKVDVDPLAKTRVEVTRGVVALCKNDMDARSGKKLVAGQTGQVDVAGNISWSEMFYEPGKEIRVQWHSPNNSGLWDDFSLWSKKLICGPTVVAEITAEDAPQELIIDDSISGYNKINALRADVGLISSFPVNVQMIGGEIQLSQLWIGRKSLKSSALASWIMSSGQITLSGLGVGIPNLIIGDECQGLMRVDGGSIDIQGDVTVGCNGKLNDDLRVVTGDGTLIVNGGGIAIGGILQVALDGGNGLISLNDGIISAIGLDIQPNGKIEIDNGILALDTDQTDSVRELIDSGLITGTAAVNVFYDEIGTEGLGRDKTIVRCSR